MSTWDIELWAMQPSTAHMTKLAELVKESVPPPWEAHVSDILPLCQWYYGFHGAGGWLHIVLDDGNLEDGYVNSCIQHALDEGDIVCWLLAGLIRTMSENNREILYTQLHGHGSKE